MKQQKIMHYVDFQNMQNYTNSEMVGKEEGSVFLIRKEINFKVFENLSKYNSNAETSSVETENLKLRNLLIPDLI